MRISPVLWLNTFLYVVPLSLGFETATSPSTRRRAPEEVEDSLNDGPALVNMTARLRDERSPFWRENRRRHAFASASPRLCSHRSDQLIAAARSWQRRHRRDALAELDPLRRVTSRASRRATSDRGPATRRPTEAAGRSIPWRVFCSADHPARAPGPRREHSLTGSGSIGELAAGASQPGSERPPRRSTRSPVRQPGAPARPARTPAGGALPARASGTHDLAHGRS